jgi:hypothetical protein
MQQHHTFRLTTVTVRAAMVMAQIPQKTRMKHKVKIIYPHSTAQIFLKKTQLSFATKRYVRNDKYTLKDMLHDDLPLPSILSAFL